MALNTTKKSQSLSSQQIKAGPELFIAIVVILIIVIGAVFYTTSYSTNKDEIDAARSRIIALDDEINQLKVQQSQIVNITREIEQLNKRLKNLRSKIPSTEDELNYFLDSVNQRARSSRISKWVLFKQEGLVSHAEYSVLPIRMEFEATYDAMILFFWDLATMGDGTAENSREQIINIREVEIVKANNNDNKSGLTMLKVNCVAETYLYTGATAAADTKK